MHWVQKQYKKNKPERTLNSDGQKSELLTLKGPNFIFLPQMQLRSSSLFAENYRVWALLIHCWWSGVEASKAFMNKSRKGDRIRKMTKPVEILKVFICHGDVLLHPWVFLQDVMKFSVTARNRRLMTPLRIQHKKTPS